MFGTTPNLVIPTRISKLPRSGISRGLRWERGCSNWAGSYPSNIELAGLCILRRNAVICFLNDVAPYCKQSRLAAKRNSSLYHFYQSAAYFFLTKFELLAVE